MFFLPIAAALVDWPGLLKLANLTSCADDDADIDGRGREVALLLCRSIPAAVLSSRDEEGWEVETVMAGEVESLLLWPLPPFPGRDGSPMLVDVTFLPVSGFEKLKVGMMGENDEPLWEYL
jgi:hypothetical protein